MRHSFSLRHDFFLHQSVNQSINQSINQSLNQITALAVTFSHIKSSNPNQCVQLALVLVWVLKARNIEIKFFVASALSPLDHQIL